MVGASPRRFSLTCLPQRGEGFSHHPEEDRRAMGIGSQGTWPRRTTKSGNMLVNIEGKRRAPSVTPPRRTIFPNPTGGNIHTFVGTYDFHLCTQRWDDG